MSEANGGPAFPKPAFYYPGTFEDGLYNGPDDGMSLRDWFAGMIIPEFVLASMTGTMAEVFTAAAKLEGKNEAQYVAHLAYDVADAMLEERQKG